MFKSPCIALACAATMFATTATGQSFIAPKSFQSKETVRGTQAAPPANYQGQWWTHPLGCEYSRAGRPGELVWYIIVNTVRDGCPHQIVINGIRGVH